MKRIIYIFVISIISVALYSFGNSHTAEGAIEKSKKAIECQSIADIEFAIKYKTEKMEFFKSVCELNDEDFIAVYPQLRPWRNEVRDNCESKIEKIEEEIDEVAERTDVVYAKVLERYAKIMESRE